MARYRNPDTGKNDGKPEKAIKLQDLYTLIRFAGVESEADAKMLARIAIAESGGVPNIVGGPNKNGTYDYGLWQINDVHGPTNSKNGQWWEPKDNARMAKKVYGQGNLCAWSSYAGPKCPISASHNGSANKVKGDPGAGGAELPNVTGAIKAALPDIPGAISNAANNFNKQIMRLQSNIGITILAVILFAIGIVLIRSNSIKSAVGTVTGAVSPVGKAGTVLKGITQ